MAGTQNPYKAAAQRAKVTHLVVTGLTFVSEVVGRVENPEPDDRFIALSALTCSLMGEYGTERQENDWATLYCKSGINPSESGINPSPEVRELTINALCLEIGREHQALHTSADVFAGLTAVS
jgi:hypothetical protein